MTDDYNTVPDDETTALLAAGWILSDERRADRLLGLTGLDAAALRAGLRAGDGAMLAALLRFVADHEADLIACADAIGVQPASLVAAAHALAGDRPAAIG